MTPEEKVEELIEKLESETNSLIKDELAIKCLIFMVNEIIIEIEDTPSNTPIIEVIFWMDALEVLKNKLIQ